MAAVLEQVTQQDDTTPISAVVKLDDNQRAALRRSEGVVTEAEACEVNSPEMAVIANTEMRTVIARKKALEDERKAFIAPLMGVIERARALFNPAIAALEKAEGIYKGKLIAFQQDEERRAAEARRIAEEAARKARQEAEAKAAAERARAEEQARVARVKAAAAEVERRRATEESERLRREGDAKAAAEADARARAAAAEHARQVEREQSVQENGEAKATEALLAAASTAPAPMPAQAPTKIAGFGSREKWVVEFEKDEQTTILAIAAALPTRAELIALLKLDTAAANRMAGALKKATNIPGMKVRATDVAVSRKG